MLIHIFEDTPHHYIPMSTFFSTKCTLVQEQEFWVRSKETCTKENGTPNPDGFFEYTNAADLVKRLTEKSPETTFVFHGLLDVNIIWRLLFSVIISRCSCVIWGYELYRYSQKKLPIKLIITKWLHRLLLSRFNKVINLTPGDAEILTQVLKRKTTTVLPYPGIGLTGLKVTPTKREDEQTIKIMVGNSAASSNEHLDAFESLKHLKEENIEIVVPLNYAGEQTYIKNVISEGEKYFGEKFKPITNMLNKEEYDKLLEKIDMTVFSHHRQQGLYVVYAMLLMGKPVYMREGTSSYQNFISLGFSINPFESLILTNIENISQQIASNNLSNQTLMNRHFTEEALAPKWSLMLNDLMPEHSC